MYRAAENAALAVSKKRCGTSGYCEHTSECNVIFRYEHTSECDVIFRYAHTSALAVARRRCIKLVYRRGGGLGSSTIFKNLMSPTPRRNGT